MEKFIKKLFVTQQLSPTDEVIRFTSRIDYTLQKDKMKEEFLSRWYLCPPSPTDGLDNYIIKTQLGSGGFGNVYLVKEKESHKYYAAKILVKEYIVKNKQVRNVLREKRVLQSLRFPLVVTLIASHKDSEHLYLILPYIAGGELFTYHRRLRKFSEKQARFYAAQVVLALEYLHYCNLIYRDLKPENILIDDHGYLKLTDFGFTKRVLTRTMTLCGTPEYLSPEIIELRPYGNSVDWWAFGVLIYEFVAGNSPFSRYNENVLIMFRKICDGHYLIPNYFSQQLRNLVKSLLQIDVTKRCGALRNGSDDVKQTDWFRGTDWIGLLNQTIHAPYIPKISSPDDVSHFESTLKKMPKLKTIANHYEEMFAEF